MSRIWKAYEAIVLDRPWLTLGAIAVATAALGAFIPRFQMDVSADSLVLENDETLEFYRDVRAEYGTDDFLIVTWTPDAGLFSDESLEALAEIRDRLEGIERIAGALTILDVPLVRGLTLDELADGAPTLSDPGVDRDAAARELRESPLYRNRLVSADGNTAAIQATLVRDEKFYRLLDARNRLREAPAGPDRRAALAAAERVFDDYRQQLMQEEAAVVAEVRRIVADYRDRAEIAIGGLPLIAADITRFIRHDIVTFGIAVVAILAGMLLLIFRQLRWVVVPMLTALVGGIMTTGFLGLVGWPVTIVSSNFLALLLIFSFSLTIHLIVRQRELHAQHPGASQRELLSQTLANKLAPCFFTVLTTAVAFGSLVVSDIRPVIDFGWIMVFSLWLSLLLAFTLYPATLALLDAGSVRRAPDVMGPVLRRFALAAEHHAGVLVAIAALVAVFAVTGLQRLTVDNRFIDYFDDETEIHRGLKIIDERLGGTTPLDVLVNAPRAETAASDATVASTAGDEPDDSDASTGDDAFDDLDTLDDLDDPFGDAEAGLTATSYWFNTARFDEIAAIHEYLDALTETGNVMSLHTTVQVLSEVDPGIVEDNFELSVLERKLPDDIRSELIAPYLSDDGQQLRIAVRVRETSTGLDRDALLRQIERDIGTLLTDGGESLRLSGMIVLYNNLLQSLFSSQIQTIGVIFLAILVTFLVTFRSLKVAVVAIVPNLLPAAAVLGILGWLGIPLDVMTITIAAITIGIGVDDTIHYIHRFKEEWDEDRDYAAAVHRAHDSIGRAMLYTSVIITIGFIVLVLSRFNPTIYFGALTAVAMQAALLVNVTLLPLLLRIVRPYGD